MGAVLREDFVDTMWAWKAVCKTYVQGKKETRDADGEGKKDQECLFI